MRLDIKLSHYQLYYIFICVNILYTVLYSVHNILGNNSAIKLLISCFGLLYILLIPGGYLTLIIQRFNIVYIIAYSITYNILLSALFLYLGVLNYTTIVLSSIIIFMIFFVWIQVNYVRFISAREYTYNLKIFRTDFLSLIFLMLCIIGSFTLKYYSNNLFLIIAYIFLQILISLIVIFNLDFSEISLWLIALGILYSVTLSIHYLAYYQSDSIVEYFVSKISYNIWNLNIPLNQNSMMSIVVLHTMLSKLLDTSLKSTFTIYYPVIYSFSILVFYLNYKKIIKSSLPALLSACLIMAFFPFFITLSRNTRTGIAELYLSFIFFVLLDEELPLAIRKFNLIIFLFMLSLSHYGSTYIMLFAILVCLVLKHIFIKYSNNSFSVFSKNIFLVFSVFSLSWYMYTSMGVCFNTLLKNIDYIVRFLSVKPKYSYTVYALSRSWPLSITIIKYMLLIILAFIAIGLITSLKDIHLNNTYYLLSLGFFTVIITTLLPTKRFNPTRVIHLSLCVLSPFAYTGILAILLIFKQKTKKAIYIFLVVTIIFFCFNLGVISETIIKDNDFSPNIFISKPRAASITNPQFIKSYYFNDYTVYDVESSSWLSRHYSYNFRIYMDHTGIFYDKLGPPKLTNGIYRYVIKKSEVRKGYIYLQYYNTILKIAIEPWFPPQKRNIYKLYPINTSSKIYTDRYSVIYLHI